MSNDSKYFIPKYIDEPMRIIIFTVDEFIVLSSVFVMFFMLGHEVLALIAGIVAYRAYKKIKGSDARGHLQRMMYWRYGIRKQMNIKTCSRYRKYKG